MRIFLESLRRSFGLAILVGCLLAWGGQAAAQSPLLAENAETDPLQQVVSEMTPEQKDALIRLIEALDEPDAAGAGATGDGADLIAQLQTLFSGFRGFVIERITSLPDLLSRIGDGLSAYGDRYTALFGFLLLGVIGGAVAEFLFARLSGSWRERIRVPSDGALGNIVAKLSLRAVLELGGVAVFVIVALAVANTATDDRAISAPVSAFILLAVGVPRLTVSVLRFVLAPSRPDLRLVKADDRVAETLFRNLAVVFGAAGVLLFLTDLLQRAGYDVVEDLRFWTGLLGTLWLIVTIWRTRKGLTDMLIGTERDLTPGLARMARLWPPFMVTILAGNWLLLQLASSTGAEVISPQRGLLIFALIILAPFLDTIVRGLARYLVSGDRAAARAETAPEDGTTGLEDTEGEDPEIPAIHRQTRLAYIRIGRVLLFSAILLTIGKLWGLTLHGLASAGVGAELAANFVGSLLILAVGYLVWETANLLINRRLIEEGVPQGGSGHEAGGEGGGAGQSRLATILPVIRVVLTAAIGIMTVLLALDRLGINVTPLLAGAGVLGLAIGFGAQTLVKDIVSGVFFLLDDAFRVGEFVDAGGTLGTVEKISMRSLVLRSVNGPIHIIPYGEIAKITNSSRDWVIMKLRFTVPFDTDLEKVRKIFKKIGQQMMEVPELAEGIIQPFKSQGAADVDDVGIIVRGKFMAKPGSQFIIRKEVYSRVQKAFQENGIDFARKEVRVQIPGLGEGRDLTPEQENAIAAAASQAAETTVDPNAPKRPADDR